MNRGTILHGHSAACAATILLIGLITNPAPAAGPATAPWGDQGDGTFRNPVLNGDFSDPDVIRVGPDYYLITSSFQYSPGMPVLHSKDLVNWQFFGHSIPNVAAIGPELNFDRMNRYNRGVWAGAIRYHAGKFWMFTATMDEGIFMTTADNPAGPWSMGHRVSDIKNVDDPCPFWDDDGQAYLLYSTPGKAWKLRIAKMAADGTSVDFSTSTILDDYHSSEGGKLYKVDGTYYVFHNENRGGKNRVGVFMRSKNLGGPWEKKLFLQSQAADRDREPNQGGLIDTPDGKKWYFLTHHGRGGFYEGRVVSLVPVKWVDGWPVAEAAGADGAGTVSYAPQPMPATAGPPAAPQSGDDFDGPTLGLQWEWNYEPTPGVWSLSERPGFLRINAMRPLKKGVLLKTPNIITQRVMGRAGGRAEVKLDLSGLVDGQQAGLCVYDKDWAMIGVEQTGGQRRVVFDTTGKPTAAGPAIMGTAVWLRFDLDDNGIAHAACSSDGKAFTPLGEAYQIKWANYRGGRIGLYTFNDDRDAGYIDIDRFAYDYPRPGAN